ncbi:hypothetical protein RS130_12940 [Paraglaciecola aquimarina]|uniref:Uncharacterized protein n=1 Tax=Paraglaciecola aquimarina TaxID=1235557 RepID=A0ABU3SXG1_9ALTE|nr:hypothetical protein [Paraglaciecola aquimarina]MDU0354703.1 hypothetical protein [Paraglaciecola aquimarina]
MKTLSRFVFVIGIAFGSVLLFGCGEDNQPTTAEKSSQKVLIFSRTMGYRHKSIEPELSG